jgi:hypothetical protein
MAMRAKHSGAVILGGGVVKHHIMNANLMRNGTDHCVYINTGQEVVLIVMNGLPCASRFHALLQFDGSDSGARPDEAVSWGKIRLNSKGVKVSGVLPHIGIFLTVLYRFMGKPPCLFLCSLPKLLQNITIGRLQHHRQLRLLQSSFLLLHAFEVKQINNLGKIHAPLMRVRMRCCIWLCETRHSRAYCGN